MVRKIEAYEAEDGQVFSSFEKAAEHDAVIRLKKLDIFRVEVVDAIVKNAEAVVGCLLSLAQAQEAYRLEREAAKKAAQHKDTPSA